MLCFSWLSSDQWQFSIYIRPLGKAEYLYSVKYNNSLFGTSLYITQSTKTQLTTNQKHRITITQNKHKKLKTSFGCLLWSAAWKWSRPITTPGEVSDKWPSMNVQLVLVFVVNKPRLSKRIWFTEQKFFHPNDAQLRQLLKLVIFFYNQNNNKLTKIVLLIKKVQDTVI